MPLKAHQRSTQSNCDDNRFNERDDNGHNLSHKCNRDVTDKFRGSWSNIHTHTYTFRQVHISSSQYTNVRSPDITGLGLSWESTELDLYRDQPELQPGLRDHSRRPCSPCEISPRVQKPGINIILLRYRRVIYKAVDNHSCPYTRPNY
jgi:hypothetical protein